MSDSREGWEPRRPEYWLVDAKDRRNCPECDQFALVETLDPPTCQVCGHEAEPPERESLKDFVGMKR